MSRAVTKRWLPITLVGLMLLSVGSIARGEGAPTVPAEYGRVIFHRPGPAGSHLYIVGQSHRSAASDRESGDNLAVQAEIYRLGEWLIDRQQVELLLPEGYFQTGEPAQSPATCASAPLLDDQSLRQTLGTPENRAGAGKLLGETRPVQLRQVEDEELYRQVGNLLRQALQAQPCPPELLVQMDDLQQQRSVALLKNIFSTVDAEYHDGAIGNRQALFLVGLAHLDEMIQLLAQHDALVKGEGDDLGITVILPPTLAANGELLRRARLGEEKL